MDEPLRIRIREINDNIVCSLCAGYYIDATTITECLHTFCKSCVVKFLQSNKHCPQCNIKIHETQPLLNLKADRVMQDIVFKLVPQLYEDEEKRKQEFYKSRGMMKVEKEDDENPRSLASVYRDSKSHHYTHDELIALCLERHSTEASLSPILKKFVRCSVRTRVCHVKLLVAKLLKLSHCDLQISCCNTAIDDDVSMKQLYISHWYGQTAPMILHYQQSPAVTNQQSSITVTNQQTSITVANRQSSITSTMLDNGDGGDVEEHS